LHQSHEIIDIQPYQNIGSNTLVYSQPFRLVIPRWAILKTSGVPDQCLSLPPSLIVGKVLEGDQDGESYAQPNVSYCVKAAMVFQSTSSEPQTRVASRMIKVVPYSDTWPPTNIHDFPNEFVGSASNSYRTSLFGNWYKMTLFMHEPPAASFTDNHSEVVVGAKIGIEVQPLAGKAHNTNNNQLVESLKNLSFKVQPVLRSKTFYSTTPFAKLPGQTMLTITGPLRLHDKVMKLTAQSSKASSWNHRANSLMLPADRASSCSQTLSESALRRSISISGTPRGTNQAEIWSSHISIPIVIPSQLPPTFCSAIASRQYSLIMQIKISSVSIKDFVLELPLQIVYSPQQARSASGDVVELMESAATEQSQMFSTTSLVNELLNESSVSRFYVRLWLLVANE